MNRRSIDRPRSLDHAVQVGDETSTRIEPAVAHGERQQLHQQMSDPVAIIRIERLLGSAVGENRHRVGGHRVDPFEQQARDLLPQVVLEKSAVSSAKTKSFEAIAGKHVHTMAPPTQATFAGSPIQPYRCSPLDSEKTTGPSAPQARPRHEGALADGCPRWYRTVAGCVPHRRDRRRRVAAATAGLAREVLFSASAGGSETEAKLAMLRKASAAVVVWGVPSDHRQVMVTDGSYERMRRDALASLARVGIETSGVLADIAATSHREDQGTATSGRRRARGGADDFGGARAVSGRGD